MNRCGPIHWSVQTKQAERTVACEHLDNFFCQLIFVVYLDLLCGGGGAFFVVVLVVALCICLCKKRKTERKASTDETQDTSEYVNVSYIEVDAHDETRICNTYDCVEDVDDQYASVEEETPGPDDFMPHI